MQAIAVCTGGLSFRSTYEKSMQAMQECRNCKRLDLKRSVIDESDVEPPEGETGGGD
jgi:hypothetical protein